MLTLPVAASLDVTVSGQWAEPAPNATWKGRAQAAEPLVALLLLRCGRRGAWAKSRHLSAALDLQFTLYLLGFAGTETQLLCFVGSGWVQDSQVSLPFRGYFPEVAGERIVTTGELIELVRVESDPPASARAAFFGRRDATLLRGEIWRLHKPLLAPLNPPWRDILSKGRNGVFEE
jgi:hypothetical protein